jgi:hypothetical protein
MIVTSGLCPKTAVAGSAASKIAHGLRKDFISFTVDTVTLGREKPDFDWSGEEDLCFQH